MRKRGNCPAGKTGPSARPKNLTVKAAWTLHTGSKKKTNECDTTCGTRLNVVPDTEHSVRCRHRTLSDNIIHNSGQSTARRAAKTMDHQIVMLKEVKKGEYIRIGKSVYVRDDYVASERKFIIYRHDDINRERLVRGNQLVEVNFIFYHLTHTTAVNEPRRRRHHEDHQKLLR